MFARHRMLSALLVVALLLIIIVPGVSADTVLIHANHGTTPNFLRSTSSVDTSGCDASSTWIWFYQVPQVAYKVENGNACNYAHLVAHRGLDGAEYCYGGVCDVKLCGKAARNGSCMPFVTYDGWGYSLYRQ